MKKTTKPPMPRIPTSGAMLSRTFDARSTALLQQLAPLCERIAGVAAQVAKLAREHLELEVLERPAVTRERAATMLDANERRVARKRVGRKPTKKSPRKGTRSRP